MPHVFQHFLDNLFNVGYFFLMAGPGFILFCYCFSFAFDAAEAAPRQAFIALILSMAVPMLVDLIKLLARPPVWADFLYSLFPHLGLSRLLLYSFLNMSILKKSFGQYWNEDPNVRILMIMQIADIFIYGFILIVIENLRTFFEKRKTQSNFLNFSEFFDEQLSKHQQLEEVSQMENDVNRRTNYAIRIVNVSRLFFNTQKEPIPAVNHVTLGIEQNSIFGFLGANGARKTTLLKMITMLLSPSAGSIEIAGRDISMFNNRKLISLCPQFNSHLCYEMTPSEHFKLYGKLHQIPAAATAAISEQLISKIGLGHFKDKLVRELSGGEQRKLAVCLAFFGDSQIILLDEPTAPLDPVARHNVHELIRHFRGKKTILLCTHLLSEAESLCDTISIMVKGSIYTIGSPQYLSAKFGTEYRIEILLNDESIVIDQRIQEFFQRELPDYSLLIQRPRSRLYSVPADLISLTKLFRIMNIVKSSDIGVNYYTCSMSSLERVFLEIVRMSSQEENS